MSENNCNLNAADFQKIGFNRPISKILVCLSAGSEKSSFEIEDETKLRQPEVSLSLKLLKKDGMVKSREVSKNFGKGRPVKYFQLEVPMRDIVSKRIDEIESEKKSVLETARKILATCEN